MGFYRFRLKLWVAGLVGFGYLFYAGPAIAESTMGENATVEAESVASPRSGHDCFDLATEQPEPLGEFRRAVMETVAVTARAAESVEEKADALAELSEAYACLGQVELADAIAQETLPLTEQIEEASTKGDVLVTLASAYGGNLADAAQMDALLLEATSIAGMLSEGSIEQHELLTDIVRVYSHAGEYQSIREMVDLVNDESVRSQLIRSALFFIEDTVSEDEWSEVLELFPELEPSSSLSSSAYDLTPWQSWQYQLHEFVQALRQANSSESVDALIAEQVVKIEAFPEQGNQVMAYIQLSEYFSFNDYTARAISLLEVAAEKAMASDSIAVSAEVEAYSLGLSLNSLLSISFAQAGEFDRSLAFLQEMDAVDQLFSRLWSLSQVTQMSLSDETIQARLVALIADTEQTARVSENPRQFLLQVAFIYYQANEAEDARELAHEVLENYGEEARTDSEFLDYLTGVLFAVGSYEDGLALLDLAADRSSFRYLPAQLLREDELDVAWKVFEKITSPLDQMLAIRNMAEVYQEWKQADAAFDLSIRVLDIAQSDTFNEAEYFDALYGDYLASFPEEQRDEQRNALLRSAYVSLFSEVIYLQESPENQRRLIQYVEDEQLRMDLFLTFFPEDTTVGEASLSDSAVDSVVQDDSYWSSVAKDAAREDQFAETIDAIALIESPAQQSRTLLTIATCHAYSTTTLDAATAATLVQIQQRYE